MNKIVFYNEKFINEFYLILNYVLKCHHKKLFYVVKILNL